MRKHYPKKKLRLMFAVCMTLIFTLSQIVQGQTGLLDPGDQTKFTNPLPIPARIDARGGGHYEMVMQETTQYLGLQDGSGNSLPTTVWGYGPANGAVSYPGPTFVAQRDVEITATWHNQLPGDGHILPVDPTLHIAHPHKPEGSMMTDLEWVRYWYNDLGNIPAVVHLHGGHTESASDGLPEAWFTQGFNVKGPQFVKQRYTYHNDQEAATLWYHDHALGITRLNVNAGLAGFYLLRDANEDMLNANGTLPSGPYEIEIVIQDRMFNVDGEFFWPAFDGDPAYDDFITGEGVTLTPPDFPTDGGPTALAEFFGDFILVNGAPWPKLDVEPRKYRFRLLNGSDSRFYVLKFSDATQFLQIGTDNGLIENATLLSELVIAPGERYDVVVDFSGKANGTEIILQNTGPDEPFKGNNFNTDVTRPTGQIMNFVVNQPLDANVPIASVSSGTSLRPAIVDHPTTGIPTRKLVLFEGSDEYGRLQPLLGTLDEGSLAWFEPITENPMLNATEIWEVYNATADAHPIHLHLVSFQIINRESFDPTLVIDKPQMQHNGTYGIGGKLTAAVLGNNPTGPGSHEMGWKDTFIVPPGQVGRVVAKFDREGRYVWHCHILSHEDHEMMRPFYVGDMPRKTGKFRKEGYVLENPTPNPINAGQSTDVEFTIPVKTHVTYKIYDSFGNLVDSQIALYDAGTYTITVPGTMFTTPGDYIFTFYAGEFYDFTRIKVR
jgi:spore coat protein A